MLDEFSAAVVGGLGVLVGGLVMLFRGNPSAPSKVVSRPQPRPGSDFEKSEPVNVAPLVEGPWESFTDFAAHASDIDALARTLYGEARGEGRRGMEAVASVILNRVADRRWEDTIKGVCLEHLQFSTWNTDDLNRRRALTVTAGVSAFADAMEIAVRAFNGQLPDGTGGANHFHTLAVDPSWNRKMTLTNTIGAHKFWVG